jgi:hypothetical protein
VGGGGVHSSLALLFRQDLQPLFLKIIHHQHVIPGGIHCQSFTGGKLSGGGIMLSRVWMWNCKVIGPYQLSVQGENSSHMLIDKQHFRAK